MRGKGISVLFLTALVLALVAACAPTAATVTPTRVPVAAPTKAAEPTKPAATPTTTPTAPPKAATVKYSTPRTLADIGVFLGLERGYFKEQSIDAQIVEMSSTAEAMPLLATGQLDVISGALSLATLQAADRGLDMRIVADMGQSRPDWEFIWWALRKDLADSGQVKKPADIKGMKISMGARGSLSELTAKIMMQNAGLKDEDVEIVLIPFAEQLAALTNKGIAAAYIMEPQLSRPVQQGLAVKWLPVSTFFGGGVQIALMTYGPNMLKDQDLGRRFMVGYLKGVRDYRKAMITKEGRQDMVSILTKYTAAKDPSTYDLMQFPYVDPNGQLDRKSLDEVYKFLIGQNKPQKTLNDLVDLSYVQYAADKLGKQ